MTKEIALVTGAARGIGAATALKLAAQGYVLWLTDVLDCTATRDAIVAAGGTARMAHLDVTDRAGCAALAARIRAEDGRLDVLVANAGICPAGTVQGDWDQWDRVLKINVDGTQNCIAAVWDGMVAQGGGRIVLVSSMAYYQGGIVVGTEYSASKGAVVGMTRHLARNGGQHGIRVNAVAPGIIDTDMASGFPPPNLASVPLGRKGSADEVAGPIAFLCGPDSGYMTGTVLNVTGGIILSA